VYFRRLRQDLNRDFGWLRRPPQSLRLRQQLANEFIRGEGIEIGALHAPVGLRPGVRVRYMDRMSDAELRAHSPEHEQSLLVRVDLIGDGERLVQVEDGSLDFLIANHFLEHAEDPIATIKRHLAVLRPGGLLFMAIPDKRWTFDESRPVTTLDHLIRDHEEGPAISRVDHLREWAELVPHYVGPDAPTVDGRVELISQKGYSIHFHVWTHDEIISTVLGIKRKFGLIFEIQAAILNRANAESILLLRRG
jgi:SAM-dependent methyltransferase